MNIPLDAVLPLKRQLIGPKGREWFSKLSGSLLCHPDFVARRVTLDATCCRLDDPRSDVNICGQLTGPRAVQVTALPCLDRYAADWRGPQTQRRDFCISPSWKFYEKP